MTKVLLGTRFDVVYHVDGSTFVSNVRYNGPILQSGWLSASGSIRSLDADNSEIVFDQFWVDGNVDAPATENRGICHPFAFHQQATFCFLAASMWGE